MATFIFSKSASAFLLAGFCLLSLIMPLFHSYDYCNEEGNIGTGYSCCVFIIKKTSAQELTPLQHRKLLGSSKNIETLEVKINGIETTSAGKGKDMAVWELRTAPLGPDPLHHHGGSPMPRISP